MAADESGIDSSIVLFEGSDAEGNIRLQNEAVMFFWPACSRQEWRIAKKEKEPSSSYNKRFFLSLSIFRGIV